MAGYIGSKASVVSSGAEHKKTFTITGATTSLTGLNYTVSKVHVFQNGVRLVDGTDYTATNGTTITLTVAAQSGDNVVVISQAAFQVALSGIDDQSNATAITIDSSENVGIGTTSPDKLLHLTGPGGSSANIVLQRTGSGLSTQSRATVEAYNNSGNAVGGISFNAAGDDDSGEIDFYVTGDNSAGASIFNLSRSANFQPGLVHFNPDGADIDFRVESSNNTHALYVDGGNSFVGINTGTRVGRSGFSSYTSRINSAAHGLEIYNSQTSGGYRNLVLVNSQSGGELQDFRYDNGSSASQVGGIKLSSTTGTTYNTTSDRRLKNNIEPIADATDKLMAMKPVTHTWITDPEAPSVHGFIAQEMQEIVPEAVSGNAESDEMMSMDYGRITPVIVAALQDALKEIKELKTRIDELESK
jgi:hypothetical protein